MEKKGIPWLARVTLADLPAQVHGLLAREWLENLRQAARNIDPETAERMWTYVNELDPYGIGGVEEESINTEYFVRSPGSDAWVCLYDLADEIQAALHGKTFYPHPLALEADREVENEISARVEMRRVSADCEARVAIARARGDVG